MINIATLDVTGNDVFAISYLKATGSPGQLRFLIRRLREHAPTPRFIFGLWPQGEAALGDAAIQRTLGADRYVGSLADAVTEIAKPAFVTAAAAA